MEFLDRFDEAVENYRTGHLVVKKELGLESGIAVKLKEAMVESKKFKKMREEEIKKQKMY